MPFYPPNNPENQNFEKLKKASGDVIILYMCTKNDDHIIYASWDMECDRNKFLSFWASFCPFTPLLAPKIKIWKKIKSTRRYYPFSNMFHKCRSYDVWFLRYKARRTEFFGIFGHFLPFNLPNNLKNHSFEKMKKAAGDIIILHLCTINDNHMIYGSWYMQHDRQNFFVIFGHFLPFDLPSNLKNYNFEIMKKIPGDIIISQLCTTNDDHMIYVSWDMELDRQNFFSFWTMFCSFTPLTNQKIKIFKYWEKHLEISSFYTSVPNIMTICYTVSKIWRVTNVIFILHFGLFFALLPRTLLTLLKSHFGMGVLL